jgi:hypothetical protein
MTITANGAYPTNYEVSALADLIAGAGNSFGSYIDNNGLPSLFADTSAAGELFPAGWRRDRHTGHLRLPGYKNFDVSFAKTFKTPFEGNQLTFRRELFNAFGAFQNAFRRARFN